MIPSGVKEERGIKVEDMVEASGVPQSSRAEISGNIYCH